ncbi:MAG: prepilin-type N-terminal cleavage/methylation domain-containing protein [Cryomorphaceae bacterium]|jgi:prepilin-type N-terminal cleavage/methylation domain-containing protein
MKTTIQPTQKRKRQGFTLVELLVVIAIIASLAGLSYGPIMKHLETSKKTEALSNGKSIHAAILGFMTQSGDFPTGTTSELCFTELFEGGHISEKKYFWNKNNRVSATEVAPIESASPLSVTLVAAENVWGYVNGLTPGDGYQPLLFDAKGTTAGVFDTTVWKGSAIIVKVDGSAKAHKIDATAAATTGDVFRDPKAVDVLPANKIFASIPSTAGVLIAN